MWRSLLRKADSSNFRFQHGGYDTQHTLVLYPHVPHLLEQFSVTDIIEEPFNINVNYIMQTTFLYHCVTLGQRVFCASVGSESVAPLMKFCFAYRFQNLQEALLDQSIGNCRDAQRAGLPVSPFGISTRRTGWGWYCSNRLFI